MIDGRQDRHEELMETARLLRAEGLTIDQMLAVLREQSVTELESIKVLCKLERLSLREAKDVFHSSDAWADLRDMHERMQEAASQVLTACPESGRGDRVGG